jgi:hypothetical protein
MFFACFVSFGLGIGFSSMLLEPTHSAPENLQVVTKERFEVVEHSNFKSPFAMYLITDTQTGHKYFLTRYGTGQAMVELPKE